MERLYLVRMYREWKDVSEQMLKDGYAGTINSGEYAAREDFSNYVGLEEVISFKDMLKLEEEAK